MLLSRGEASSVRPPLLQSGFTWVATGRTKYVVWPCLSLRAPCCGSVPAPGNTSKETTSQVNQTQQQQGQDGAAMKTLTEQMKDIVASLKENHDPNKVCPHCKKLHLLKPNLRMQGIFPLDQLMESAHCPQKPQGKEIYKGMRLQSWYSVSQKKEVPAFRWPLTKSVRIAGDQIWLEEYISWLSCTWQTVASPTSSNVLGPESP